MYPSIAWQRIALAACLVSALAVMSWQGAQRTGATGAPAAVSAGPFHTCAVTTASGVKCWGENVFGELGDGSTTNRSSPVDVSTLTSGVSTISSGGNHTCALTVVGGVKCWGINYNGELGDGQACGYVCTTPVDVSGLSSGTIAIAAGHNHTCALTAGGGVKCWGLNANGQLGDGTLATRTTPFNVSGLTSGIVAITSGYYHTCAISTGGGAKCWGYNYFGQLGDGATVDRAAPFDVSTLNTGVTAISAGGSHTCAIIVTGGMKCWGYNYFGQLGDGQACGTTCNTPVNVSGLTSGVSAISANGLYHTCAKTSVNELRCWGSNASGQVGDGTTTDRTTPTVVSGFTSGSIRVSAGGSHTCAITAAGSLKCWGYNGVGQLGDGTTTDRTTPVDVSGLSSGSGAAIAAGGNHTCALTTGGGVKCWGSNTYGQLGNGTNTDSNVPVNVSGLTSGVAAISAGWGHNCALTTGGGVKCWGRNEIGRLGDGTTTNRNTPVDVSGLTSGVAAISAGEHHTCAVTTGGGLKCWGGNDYGNLGNGTYTESDVPADVTGLTSGVAAGGIHTCALTTGGGVKCWGYGVHGELGNGSNGQSNVPVDVTGMASGVAAITGGFYHTCAVTTGGGAKCWGYGFYGKVGNSANSSVSTPVDVTGLTSGVAAISGGWWDSCARTTSGGLKCWGRNDSGQLGNGTNTDSNVPVSVSLKGPADTDGDGCPNVRELVTGPGAQNSGGNRDPGNPNDYFNPSHDGVNRVDDILLVVQAYFKDRWLDPPTNAIPNPAYDPGFDRTLVGPNAWNLGPPNGLQRVDDILNSVHQYFHDCS